jgi:hypothetical protein
LKHSEVQTHMQMKVQRGAAEYQCTIRICIEVCWCQVR